MTDFRKKDDDDTPKEPYGLGVHWDQGKDDMTIEEMLENDLIVEQIEYLEIDDRKNLCN